MLLCTALVGLSAAGADKMTVSFDGKNVLRSIKVGASSFATGGGDLWSAEFSDGTNRAVRASCGTSRSACSSLSMFLPSLPCSPAYLAE